MVVPKRWKSDFFCHKLELLCNKTKFSPTIFMSFQIPGAYEDHGVKTILNFKLCDLLLFFIV